MSAGQEGGEDERAHSPVDPAVTAVVKAAQGGGASRSFYAHMRTQGLRAVLQPGRYDAATLCRIARESIAAQELVATGCLLIQSVALVQAWTLLHHEKPNADNHDAVVRFGQLAAVRTPQATDGRMAVDRHLLTCCGAAVVLCRSCPSLSILSRIH